MKSLTIKKKNRKGMTLVEVVTAMSLFSITSVMIVMTLCAASKSIGDNYKRANDVYTEGVSAETFDVNKSVAGSVKVERNNISGSGASNKVKITAGLPSTYGGNLEISNVYGYKSKLPDSNFVNFQLQFFQSTNNYADCVDPSNNDYFVMIYNDTSTEVNDWSFKAPDTTNSYLFNTDKVQFDSSNTVGCGLLLGGGGSTGIGVHFADSITGNILEIENGSFALTKGDLDTYAEVNDSGDKTGIIILHYTADGWKSQSEYETYVINQPDETTESPT